MSEGYLAARSLAFRANLAQLVSPLRRVRSKSPFFKLQAHRIPTLWALYRGLLRNSPTEDVKFRIRVLFRQGKGSTGIERTVKDLKKGHKWLEFFKKAKDGDAHCQAVMARYSSLIATKREKAWMMRRAREELEFQAKMRHRPILTGGYLRPTINHGPLPRMKPQPPAISHMIINRLKKRERRHGRRIQLEEDQQDLAMEDKFERGLQQLTTHKFEPIYSGSATSDWRAPISETLGDIKKSVMHEYARAAQPFPPELVERILEARREKIRNKTREKERERRGEVTTASIRRQRKGPPAHILAKMSPKQREMDKISRNISEVGYVGLVKKRLGFKLRDPELPHELGKKENRPLLDRAAQMIRAENQRKAREEKEAMKSEPRK